jgi:hypothetical protein
MRLGQDRVGGNVRELKPRRRLTALLKRLSLVMIFLVLAVSTARYAWGVYGDRVWARELARYRDAGAPLTVAALAAQAPPPGQDAGPDLLAAADLIYADPRGSWVLPDAESLAPLDDEQMVLAAGLIRRLDGVWARLDAAERKPYAGGYVDTANVHFFRSLGVPVSDRVAPFLQIAARYYHQCDDEPHALRCVRRMLSIADAAGRAPDGQWTSSLASQAAARSVLQMAPTLRVGGGGGEATAAEVRALVGALLDESRAQSELVRGLEWQRAFVRDQSEIAANGSGHPDYRLPTFIFEPWQRWVVRPMILTDAVLMLRQADQMIAAARASDDVPTLLSVAPDARGLRVLREEHPLWHLWAVTCWPSYEGEVREHFQALAERRLAATALAVRAYSAAHGDALPSTLGALVPEWLPAVPGDPMAHARPLTFRPDPADPLLYSVGRDGVDDGGCDEFPDRQTPPEKVEWLHIWSKRDAVVHLKGVRITVDKR